MIRFSGMMQDGRRLVGIGLSDGNIEHLKLDHPIVVDGRTVNVPDIEVLIVWGHTEQDVAAKVGLASKAPTRTVRRDELPPQPPLNCTPMMFRSITKAWFALMTGGSDAEPVTDIDCDTLYERLTGKRPAW